ncbi:formate dehydrogenase [Fictibacillus phosphorivorans]|uniref:Formate dehydrogenase n=1 Tax=Fictibacillus phosphorivorans TaxID=1221500 RepID=A0A165P479_9BACL|nr:DinB family protein [Fictibacillus phosphorivorans]KZE68920.1 formate dehydrogenase [Fictibacillus phosphorivorans]
MSHLTIQNVELSRGFFLKHLEGMTAELAEIQPEGFNNNILWHVGHVLTTAEYFLFGFPEKSLNLPKHYIELFNRGTSPKDWKREVPALAELKQQLAEQLERIKQIPEERLHEKLEKEFFNFKTFGELVNFAVFHETYHLGQMHAIKRIIENQSVKQV